VILIYKYLCAGLIIFSVIGNSLVLYNLLLGRDSLGKKRSKTIFLHITLADVMVTMFPRAGSHIIMSDTVLNIFVRPNDLGNN
jgi:hypothetical protein